jgi:hypothetical protein
MNWNKRPLSVTIIACVYIAVGAIGFVYHFTEFHARDAFQYDAVWVELVRFLAITAGAFMLRGHNWARWLALAWIAFHVIIGRIFLTRVIQTDTMARRNERRSQIPS